jgi:hypothetical protein
VTDTLVLLEVRKANADAERRHQELMDQTRLLNKKLAALAQALGNLVKSNDTSSL